MTPRGSAANDELFKPISEVSFGKKRETSYELRNYNLNKTDEDVQRLLQDLLATGQDVAASRAFFASTHINQNGEELLQVRERLLDYSLSKYFSHTNITKPLDDLIEIGKTLDWTISMDNCCLIEECTREQHAEPLWFKLRYGRITASIFARCVKTNISKPSQSLLTTIFAQNQIQYFPATLHGKRNEHRGVYAAIEAFENHVNIAHRKSGLIISPDFSYFAASPDHIIECDCCGMVVVEVKCPFKFDFLTREEGINALIKRHQPYVLREADGALSINSKHPYYYQVQMQIFLTKAAYGFLLFGPQDLRYF